jgi:hypothetical protein
MPYWGTSVKRKDESTMIQQLQNHDQPCITFHIARDPEFLQGIQDGRQLLPEADELTGSAGWWDVESLLQFVRAELSPHNQPQETPGHARLNTSAQTPIYNLGIIAGFFAAFAEVATVAIAEPPQVRREMFSITNDHFLAGMRLGAAAYQQEYGNAPRLADDDLLAFFRSFVTPFEPHALTHTGILVGWFQAFHAAAPVLVFQTTDFATGFLMGSQGWMKWNKAELLTDRGFAECLAHEVSPSLLASMHAIDPEYTEAYQIGFACGLVSALVSDPTIALVEQTSDRQQTLTPQP